MQTDRLKAARGLELAADAGRYAFWNTEIKIHMGLKGTTINIFAGIGFVSVLAIVFGFTYLNYNKSKTSSQLNVPLKRELNTQRYLQGNFLNPLVKKDGYSIFQVKVLEETPTSATFRIHFNAPDESILDIPSIGLWVLKDSGFPAPFIYHPPTKPNNYGKWDDFYFAIIKVEMSRETTADMIATNHILFFFAEENSPAYHEDRFEYERIWCRQPGEISDLWKDPFPEEKTSAYSIKGTRSISRLCIDI